MVEPTESSTLLAQADSKGKNLIVSPNTPKKRKLVKVSEVVPKKSKLLAPATSVVRAIDER